MKLLHVADVHLDAPFRWLGSRGREQRRQLRETFRAIVDLALAERVDALLVAGDLFDSNAPSQEAVDLVRTQFRRLEAPVFILPGTHDCLDGSSIYRKVDFAASAGPHVRVFDGERSTFRLDSLGLAVHGRANRTKTSPESPLAGLSPVPGARHNVALAHGSLAMPGTAGDFPIRSQEIAASGMDYVALGHWHSHRDCSAGRTVAGYSGPPELLADGEEGCVVLVELAEGGARATPRRVGRRRQQRVEIPLDGLHGAEEIAERLHALRDPDLVLSVVLGGVRPLDLDLDPAELTCDLAEGFFSVRIEDRSHPEISAEELRDLPEGLVIGQFARRMGALVAAAASDEERRVRESALQLGLALLRGRKVL